MGGMGEQYGPYVVYFLSQLLQKRQAMEAKGHQAEIKEGEAKKEDVCGEKATYFAGDETAAQWHRQEDVEILKQFCREGYAQAKKHGHFIVGTGEKGDFIGIPGRFLIEEQPAGGTTGFILWQPLAGGEELYEDLEKIDEETAKSVFGYWIAAIDSKTLKISEVW